MIASGAILAGAALLSLTTTVFTVIALGIGLAGLLAAGIYYVYKRSQDGEREINKWVDIFTLIVNGQAEEALPLLRQQLTANSLAHPGFIPNADVDSIFKPHAYQNYASLDIRHAHAKQGYGENYNRYLLKGSQQLTNI